MSNLTHRLIACFDVRDGLVTKGQKFQNNVDVGLAEDIARFAYREQIDEVIVYDILASTELRGPDLDTVRRISRQVFVPLTVGGGIKSVHDMHQVLAAGAEKISIDSMAVRNPSLVSEGAKEFGSQCIVLSIQVKRIEPTPSIPSGYEVAIDGARTFTGKDALQWAIKGQELGAGEICVNSIDQDGTHAGYDMEITKLVTEHVSLPVIASGGAGNAQHVADVCSKAGASAAIVSSLLYSPALARHLSVRELKTRLQEYGGQAETMDRPR